VVLAYEFNLSAYSVSVITIYGPLGLGINPKGYYGTYIMSNEYPVVIGVDKRWIVYDDVENVVYADRIYGYNVGVISVESITVKVVYAGDVKVSPVVRSPSSVVDILNESYGGGGLSICKYTLDLVIGNDGGDAVVLGGSAESLEVYYLMMLFIVPVALVLGLLYERRKLLKSFEKILILQFPSPIPKVLLFPRIVSSGSLRLC